jgi:Phage portal protein, SPP1 Gp6-like
MAVVIPNDIKKQLESMLSELDKRARRCRLNEKYLDGAAPIPDAIVRAKVTKAYRNLIPVTGTPWGNLIVDAAQDRLEVAGISSGDKHTDDVVWGAWQDNNMDAESALGHCATLTDGRAFATVWRPPGSKGPEISLDDAATMIIRYAEGSRRKRVAALRRWKDEDERKHLTLFRPDGIFKFSESKEQMRAQGRVKAGETWWEAREEDEQWPLANPYGVVPVVEIAVNRRLKSGCYPYARGDFEHSLGLIDRINLLTFLGLVVAFWMGFPLRGVVGEKILYDDDGERIAPFDSNASGVFQFENSKAEIKEFKAADRGNLSILPELDQLATVTKTARYYFPIEGGYTNISVDTIRASEGLQNAKIFKHKGTIGESDEEILRLCGLMSDEQVILSPRAELKWRDHESHSMAERADAASKIASVEGIPWQFVAEKFLNCSQEEVAKLEAQAAGSALAELVKEAKEPAVIGT